MVIDTKSKLNKRFNLIDKSIEYVDGKLKALEKGFKGGLKLNYDMWNNYHDAKECLVKAKHTAFMEYSMKDWTYEDHYYYSNFVMNNID
jgi:hypothetical protein